MSSFRVIVRILLLVVFLTSCSPAPTPTLAPPTSPPPQPTEAKPATVGDGAPFKTGARYSDTRGDMPISFLDVLAFQANVDEESETLEIVLHMRDIPETVTRGQVTNFFEYIWMVFVYLDPSEATQMDQPSDYYLALNTNIEDPMADTRHPIPGTPVSVPFYQLFENRSIYNSAGKSISAPNVEINPDRDTLTLTGRVP